MHIYSPGGNVHRDSMQAVYSVHTRIRYSYAMPAYSKNAQQQQLLATLWNIVGSPAAIELQYFAVRTFCLISGKWIISRRIKNRLQNYRIRIFVDDTNSVDGWPEIKYLPVNVCLLQQLRIFRTAVSYIDICHAARRLTHFMTGDEQARPIFSR